MFKAYAAFDTYLIRGTGVEAPGEVIDKPEIMARAETLALRLVG
jgi:hypothetical protein